IGKTKSERPGRNPPLGPLQRFVVAAGCLAAVGSAANCRRRGIMQLNIFSEDPSTLTTAILSIPCFEEGFQESAVFIALDKKLDGVLARVVKDEDYKAKRKQSLVLHTHGKVGPQRVMLVGLGARK